MLRHVQIAGLLACALGTLIGIFTIATAEPPSPAKPPTPVEPPTPTDPLAPADPSPLAEPPFPLTDPLLPPAEPLSSAAKQKILAALGGDAPNRATGDGVLDDLLHVIEQRGSILDGSSLDSGGSGSEPKSLNMNSKQAYAAEKLLQAARLLESVGPSENDRAELVHRMRAEARKLLSE